MSTTLAISARYLSPRHGDSTPGFSRLAAYGCALLALLLSGSLARMREIPPAPTGETAASFLSGFVASLDRQPGHQIFILRVRLAMLEAEKANHLREVNRYMANHKLAVLALAAGYGGGLVCLDPASPCGRDARAAGAAATAAAFVYAMANAGEIMAVAREVVSASRLQNDYESRIASLRRRIVLAQNPAPLASGDPSLATTDRALSDPVDG